MSGEFTLKVLQVVSKIPRGRVLTYAQVAQKAGSPQAYRAVGSILHRNYRERAWQLPIAHPRPIPCHRVIRSDGRCGGYARGASVKEKILQQEGLKVEKHKIISNNSKVLKHA